MKTQISIDRWGGKRLVRVLALLLALAVAPTMLRAQGLDPTGAWLLKWFITVESPFGQPFALAVFHQGGTFTGDVQGESAFDPHTTSGTAQRANKAKGSKLGLNVIVTPHSGVWQMTPDEGDNTFDATFMVIEYEVQTNPPAAPLFQLTKLQYFGTLTSADTMTLEVVGIHYDENGKEKDSFGFDATGVRVEAWPSTPIPTPTP